MDQGLCGGVTPQGHAVTCAPCADVRAGRSAFLRVTCDVALLVAFQREGDSAPDLHVCRCFAFVCVVSCLLFVQVRAPSCIASWTRSGGSDALVPFVQVMDSCRGRADDLRRCRVVAGHRVAIGSPAVGSAVGQRLA